MTRRLSATGPCAQRWLVAFVVVLMAHTAERRNVTFTSSFSSSPKRLAFERFARVPVLAVDLDSEVADFIEDEDELMAMLMSGTGDEVDILGNGSLVKTIIQPAPAFSRRPQLGDEVTVHFVA